MIQLSDTDIQFISDHLTDDVQQLLLQTHPAGLDMRKLAAQILARQKARDKLPSWYGMPRLIFPPALSVEQASSEQAARYKASLVAGKLLLDLTGGMGVDTAAFARRVEQVRYVEQQPHLADLAAHNLPLLGATNVVVEPGDGLTVATTLAQPADWLYLDPHRRDGQGGRVVRLGDCEPDVTQPAVLGQLMAHTRRLLLKASPLIDIDGAIQQLRLAGASGVPERAVEAVHVVAVLGEVKEVLFIVSNPGLINVPLQVNSVNLLADRQVSFAFSREEETHAAVRFGDPQQYIYEPNAAIMKAGGFRRVAEAFDLLKLAPNSHLYTSYELIPDFPGRVFALQAVLRPDRKAVLAHLPDQKANLTVRNFPQSVADLRKKLGLREGGNVYLLATTLLSGEKRLLLTRKATSAADEMAT